jgi:hypothetical protein
MGTGATTSMFLAMNRGASVRPFAAPGGPLDMAAKGVGAVRQPSCVEKGHPILRDALRAPHAC